MRRSGLTHLLSVSGLHIAAVVASAMLLSLKLLALSERLALRFNLVLVSAGVAAAAGIGYTLLTGAQVPTVRSCVAALLILLGIALGRDAISIRLVAVGALVVLLFRPEALAGAELPDELRRGDRDRRSPLDRLGAPRCSSGATRGSSAASAALARAMVMTGLAVELALMPIALFHFHRAGLYGVGANIVAIPLTTFVDHAARRRARCCSTRSGSGQPLWWLTRPGDRAACSGSPTRWLRATRRGGAAALDARPGRSG